METNLLIGLAACGTAAVAAAAGYVILASRRDQERKRRVDMFIRRTSQQSDNRDVRAEVQRKKVNSRLRSLEEQKRHAKSRLGAVSALIQQAGLEISVTKFWMVCMTLGLLAASFCVVQKMPVYAGPIAGAAFIFILPKMYLRFLGARRAKEFTKHFVGGIDIIYRGLKSGLPPQECFRIIARETPDPCGYIFRQIIGEINAGIGTVEAMQRAYARMPTQEFMFFCTVIAVQDQTGGNLADILGNISNVLRGRAALREKVKALSGEARASAMIVGALPFAVGMILYFINYDYIALLWQTRIGQIFFAAACIMMFLGVFIMMRMGKLDM